MLPNTGKFRLFSCPDDREDGNGCPRPYCYFVHKKKLKKDVKKDQNEASTSTESSDRNESYGRNILPTVVPAVNQFKDIDERIRPPPLKEDDINEKAETTTTITETPVESSVFIQQLVSDAVKKVLSENPTLAASGIDVSTIVNSLDTSTILEKANVGNVNSGSSIVYNRPINPPSYNPTPIDKLKQKNSEDDNNEYDPQYVPIKKSNIVSEVTNEINQAEESSEEMSTEFDMLEEVLVKENDKISEDKLRQRKSQLVKNCILSKKSKTLEKKVCNKANSPHQSPVFTSSNVESNLEMSPYSNDGVDSSIADLHIDDGNVSQISNKLSDNEESIKQSSDSENEESSKKTTDIPNDSENTDSNNCDFSSIKIKEEKVSNEGNTKENTDGNDPKNESKKTSHSLLPQVVALGHVRSKSVTSVSKSKDAIYDNIQNMLQQMDSIDSGSPTRTKNSNDICADLDKARESLNNPNDKSANTNKNEQNKCDKDNVQTTSRFEKDKSSDINKNNIKSIEKNKKKSIESNDINKSNSSDMCEIKSDKKKSKISNKEKISEEDTGNLTLDEESNSSEHSHSKHKRSSRERRKKLSKKKSRSSKEEEHSDGIKQRRKTSSKEDDSSKMTHSDDGHENSSDESSSETDGSRSRSGHRKHKKDRKSSHSRRRKSKSKRKRSKHRKKHRRRYRSSSDEYYDESDDVEEIHSEDENKVSSTVDKNNGKTDDSEDSYYEKRRRSKHKRKHSKRKSKHRKHKTKRTRSSSEYSYETDDTAQEDDDNRPESSDKSENVNNIVGSDNKSEPIPLPVDISKIKAEKIDLSIVKKEKAENEIKLANNTVAPEKSTNSTGIDISSNKTQNNAVINNIPYKPPTMSMFDMVRASLDKPQEAVSESTDTFAFPLNVRKRSISDSTNESKKSNHTSNSSSSTTKESQEKKSSSKSSHKSHRSSSNHSKSSSSSKSKSSKSSHSSSSRDKSHHSTSRDSSSHKSREHSHKESSRSKSSSSSNSHEKSHSRSKNSDDKSTSSNKTKSDSHKNKSDHSNDKSRSHSSSSRHSKNGKSSKSKESSSSSKNSNKETKDKPKLDRKESSCKIKSEPKSPSNSHSISTSQKLDQKRGGSIKSLDIKNDINAENKSAKRPRIEEIRRSSKDDSPENSSAGSPLPDLSALDELPEEDWDELLQESSSVQDKNFDHSSDDASDRNTLLPNMSDSDSPGNHEELGDSLDFLNDFEEKGSVAVDSKIDDSDSDDNAIFPHLSKKRKLENDEPVTMYPPSKVRLARTSESGNLLNKPSIAARKKTATQIMMERFKKLKDKQSLLEKKLEEQRLQLELQQQKKASASSSSLTPAISNSSKDFSKVIRSPATSSTSFSSSKKRISRVPNVAALLKTQQEIKSRINIAPAQPSTSTLKKSTTISQTNAKGNKRVAHVPANETLTRPIIKLDGTTKVPQNIRQRYLNSFVDECLKWADITRLAYKIAVAEETVCHNRATSRMIYLNLSVNTLKRLRNQEVSEAAQEIITKEEAEENNPQLGSPQVSSTSSPQRNHPLNPNHRPQNHFASLASGGQKGTWSIEKRRKLTDSDVEIHTRGVKFYNNLKKYLMTTEQLENEGYPRPDPNHKGRAILVKFDSRKKISPSPTDRWCDRCGLQYKVDKWGLSVSAAPCRYHWGRAFKKRGFSGFETVYSCCQGDGSSEKCCQAATHVSQNFNPKELRGYVRTLPKNPNKEGNYGVFSLDCEMSYTSAGNELTRVTVINSSNKVVYESFVLPENPIIDYNTRFSGITEQDMLNVRVTIKDVQKSLLSMFNDKTILMGHSLESDLHALKIIHDTVVDTSLVFPHKMGAPFKRALRNLASEYLKKIIQNDVSGHDSAEDALACMQLMHWKIKEDLKAKP